MAGELELRVSTTPYPGLRPFAAHEADVFFGRETQTDEMLRRLRRSRFLLVTGPSGCGKSSLVRAGMIAALEAGFLSDAGGRWRIADMRPGERPLQRLTDALLPQLGLAGENASPETAAFVRATLQRGPLGLVEVLREWSLPPGANLLLLVDQFEEIFRFRREGDPDEAEAFVALLLASAAQREIPVYVVLTMRSDFLGDCALFAGLPEAINDNQFLTPRLTRAQAEAAIAKPARVFWGEIHPALVSRLLNDMSAEPDQLPVLQHTLMRMWNRVRPGGDPYGSAPAVVTLDDYLAVGTLERALSNHADEVYGSLSGGDRAIAEVMFRRLTERGEDQRDTRRPTRVGEIAEVAGVAPEDVVRVAEPFRRSDRSFLMPPPGVPLRPETVLDISHESLIRQWQRLADWVKQEERSAAIYRHLKQTARLWKAGEADLLAGAGLERALAWKLDPRTRSAWAARYGSPGDFELVLELLDASEHQQRQRLRMEDEERERRRREEIERQADARAADRLRRRAWALGIIAVLATGLGIAAASMAIIQARTANRLEQQRLQTEMALDSLRIRNERLISASEQLAGAALFRQQVESLDSSVAARAEANADSAAAARVVPLVYIQFRGGLERSLLEELRAQLNREGYQAPGTERIRYDFNSHVSYFHAEDRALADTIAARTVAFFRERGCTVTAPLRYLPQAQSRVKRGQVEIWVHDSCPD